MSSPKEENDDEEEYDDQEPYQQNDSHGHLVLMIKMMLLFH